MEILHNLGARDNDLAIASDEEEALAWFGGTAPSVVFAEFIGAKNDDGLDLLHEILERAPECKIVLVTAEPRDSPEVRAALRAGIFAYVEKPVRHEKIRDILGDIQRQRGDSGRI